MRTMTFAFPAIERLIYGKPAADTLRAESERIGAKRVFLIVSGTMNRTTDEVANVRTALGERCAGAFDAIPPFTPRSAVVEAARAARASDADLIVTFGGGSVTEAGKLVRLCLQHDITDVDGFEPFRIVVDAHGKRTLPA